MAEKKKKKVVSKKHLARSQREAKQIRLIVISAIVVGVLILGLVGYGLVEHFIIRPRKTVAEVGDTVITVEDFESRVQYSRVQMLNQIFQYYTFYQQFGEFGASFLQSAQSLASQMTQPVQLGSEVLDEMIDDILIREEAAKRGITVSEEEIDAAVQTAFGFYPDGTPTPTVTATIQATPTYSETQLALVTLTNTPTETSTPTETPEVSPTPSEPVEEEQEVTENAESVEGENAASVSENTLEETAILEQSPTITFTPTITSTPTPYTTELYANDVEEFNKNFRAYDFQYEDLRDLFEVQLLREKLMEEITNDLVPVKEEVWARHILVETEEEAQEVLELLEQGADFHSLAAERSTDESNKDQGGDLGWFDKETMVAPFTEVAFGLEIGEISEPVETDFGYHIIQVLGHREVQIPPNEFETDKAEAFQNWLNELRNSRDDIIIHDEWEEYVPKKPEIPQQLLVELYQQGQ